MSAPALANSASLIEEMANARILAEEGEVISSNRPHALYEYERAISFPINHRETKRILIDIESSGRWNVVNSDGCGGLFQFCPKTRKPVMKALGIPPSQWMRRSNQELMFDYLYNKNKEALSGYDLPLNIWFMYGAWQQGPGGIRSIARTLRDRVRLSKVIHKNIRNNLSSRDKSEWEFRTREVMYTIWRNSSMRKPGTKLFVLGRAMTSKQKRLVRKTLTKEGFRQYKLESDSILATIWSRKFSTKIANNLQH